MMPCTQANQTFSSLEHILKSYVDVVLEKFVVEPESDIGALKAYSCTYLPCPLTYGPRFTELLWTTNIKEMTQRIERKFAGRNSILLSLVSVEPEVTTLMKRSML
jgi:hypothetical protein